MMDYLKMIVHALVLAVIVTVIGTLIHKLKLFPSSLPIELRDKCRHWNSNYCMQKKLFLAGLLTSLLYQFADIKQQTNMYMSKALS